MNRSWTAAVASLLPLLLSAGAPSIASVDPPAAPGSMGPNLVAVGDSVLLTWLEPLTAGERPDEGNRALRYAAFDGRKWSAPRTLLTGGKFFANWADFPAIAAASEGWLLAGWPEKSGNGDDVDLELARASGPEGPWRRIGAVHEPTSPGEHGFLSLVPEGNAVRAFWLDGREMKGGEGTMTLRTALVGERAQKSEPLDARVCDCCQTSAAATAGGPVVVYRDRSEKEVRDISIVRRAGEKWTSPRNVARDGWRIGGCPVNGPAVAAAGGNLAVVWFTAARQRPSVRIAFSSDAGASFGKPIEVDGAGPAGRVGVLLDAGGDAFVSWIAAQGSEASIRLRRVRPDGRSGVPITVAPTSLARSSGVPRIARLPDRLLVAWVEASEPFRLHAATVPISAIPRPM